MCKGRPELSRAGAQSQPLRALPIGWIWVVDEIEISAGGGVVVTYAGFGEREGGLVRSVIAGGVCFTVGAGVAVCGMGCRLVAGDVEKDCCARPLIVGIEGLLYKEYFSMGSVRHWAF